MLAPNFGPRNFASNMGDAATKEQSMFKFRKGSATMGRTDFDNLVDEGRVSKARLNDTQ